jgi:hypothetical protein
MPLIQAAAPAYLHWLPLFSLAVHLSRLLSHQLNSCQDATDGAQSLTGGQSVSAIPEAFLKPSIALREVSHGNQAAILS